MKFGQFISYYKRKKFMKKFCKNCDLKTSSWHFFVRKELSITSVGKFYERKLKFLKQAAYQICNTKIIKSYGNQFLDLLRFLFTEDVLKIKKDPELVSRSHFPLNFLTKIYLQHFYTNWPNFVTRLRLVPKRFSKMCFVFDAQAFDDVMTYEYLKS